MGNIVIDDQEMTVEYSSPRYYWSIRELTWRSLWGLWRLVDSLSIVNGRFVGAVAQCQNL